MLWLASFGCQLERCSNLKKENLKWQSLMRGIRSNRRCITTTPNATPATTSKVKICGKEPAENPSAKNALTWPQAGAGTKPNLPAGSTAGLL
jgi:hypothetical protein